MSTSPIAQNSARFVLQKHSLLTVLYLVLLVLVFALQSYFQVNTREMGINRYVVWTDSTLRLLTAPISHMSFSHLIGNILFLFPAGLFIDRLYGKRAWLAIAVLSIVFASAASVVFVAPMDVALGSSDVGMGFLGALCLSMFSRHSRQVPKKILGTLIVVGLILLFAGLTDESVNNVAHFAGFGAGVAAGFILLRSQNKMLSSVFVLILVLVLGGFGARQYRHSEAFNQDQTRVLLADEINRLEEYLIRGLFDFIVRDLESRSNHGYSASPNSVGFIGQLENQIREIKSEVQFTTGPLQAYYQSIEDFLNFLKVRFLDSAKVEEEEMQTEVNKVLRARGEVLSIYSLKSQRKLNDRFREKVRSKVLVLPEE